MDAYRLSRGSLELDGYDSTGRPPVGGPVVSAAPPVREQRSGIQRLENWKRLRAPACPYFFLSTIRGVARQESVGAERGVVGDVIRVQGAGDAVPACLDLGGDPAALAR